MSEIALQNAAAATSQTSIPAGAFGQPVAAPAQPAAPAAGKPEGDAGKPTAQPASPQPQALNLEDPSKATVVPDADTTTEFTYDPTGDAGLDYALNFVGKLGYGDTHPAILAAKDGDFTLLKVELATKGVAGGAEVVKLAEEAHARHAKEAQAQEQELSGFAVQTAGSAENWAVVRQWAATNATPQEKAQVNSALSQGGLVAKGVISQLVSLYQAQNTLPKSPAQVAKDTAGSQVSTSGQPLTAKLYGEKVQELFAKHGSRASDTVEYANLQSERLAAKRLGY